MDYTTYNIVTAKTTAEFKFLPRILWFCREIHCEINNLTAIFSAKFTAKSYNSSYRGTAKFHLLYRDNYLPLMGGRWPSPFLGRGKSQKSKMANTARNCNQSLDNSLLSSYRKFQPDWPKNG